MREHEFYNRLAEAVQMMEAVLPDLREILGPEHPDLISAEEALTDLKNELAAQGYPTSLH